VKFEVTASFQKDFKKLKAEHKAAFKQVVRNRFAAACDAWADATARRKAYVWPKNLRVDELTGAPGIMEMTWSFASPDGRATFSLIKCDEDWLCVWRRIGNHDVFKRP